MHLIDGLGKAQRVVVVVALGLALVAVGSYLVSLGGGFHFGWTGAYTTSSRIDLWRLAPGSMGGCA